ncbi:hypothetical protein PENSPDRAFT_672603 [Peniophora sp. CONT]|nr:hypothetical protein PENSPDRAFT_672603 [Peniophora sp. CONT]
MDMVTGLLPAEVKEEGPPNRAPLWEAANLLDIASELDFDQLEKVLHWMRRVFKRSRHIRWLAEPNGMTPGEVGGDAPPVTAGNLLELRHAALDLSAYMRARASDPRDPSAAELLHHVLTTAL